jgi:hypothetical protein
LYTAYIIGGGKRLEAVELKDLFVKIKREGIDIARPEQIRAEQSLMKIPEVVIRGSRPLSQTEMYYKTIKNPFSPPQKEKTVCVRFVRDSRQ